MVEASEYPNLEEEKNPQKPEAEEKLKETEYKAESSDKIEEYAKEVKSLKEELSAYKDKLLRAASDLHNFRRRAEIEIAKAHKFALENFSRDLLIIVDTLERGLELSDPNDPSIKPMRDGMELTLKMFNDTFIRYNIKVLETSPGDLFNPTWHQAMSIEESSSSAEGSIKKIFQKGYLLNGRLLRPAMVVVARKATPAKTTNKSDNISTNNL